MTTTNPIIEGWLKENAQEAAELRDFLQPQRLWPGLLTAKEAGVPPVPGNTGDLSRIEVYFPKDDEERAAIKAWLAERNKRRAQERGDE